MNRAQFMEQLARLLSDISDAEREEALDYYESYFDDAGAEKESEVIRELGSPGKVAAIIKADLKESNDSFAEYTELGYEDARTREAGQMPDKYTQITRTGAAGENQSPERNGDGFSEENVHGSQGRNVQRDSRRAGQEERRFGRDRARFEQTFSRAGEQMDQALNKAGEKAREGFERAERGYHYEKKKNHTGAILLLIVLVFVAPFIPGIFGGILGVAVTILLLPFLLVFALGAAALGLVIGAVGTVLAGIAACFENPAAGILMIGAGCLLMALGILAGVAVIWLAGKMLPVLLRKITDFCQRILAKFRRRGEGA
ncbi:DUF1700 domain-containing protein [Blautia sp. HCP3S3_G3]|uniref:DUF1700 domain-containing protein n=1 Tax=Blautia sp. HCP3S3_G3 TaxID=3438913 RepID=UPI003F8C4B66